MGGFDEEPVPRNTAFSFADAQLLEQIQGVHASVRGYITATMLPYFKGLWVLLKAVCY